MIRDVPPAPEDPLASWWTLSGWRERRRLRVQRAKEREIAARVWNRARRGFKGGPLPPPEWSGGGS